MLIYEKQFAPEYVVLCNESDRAFITDELPTECGFFEYYVFPKNLAWTLSITHEDGWLGPFFAKHKGYSKLNEENHRIIKKNAEIEKAKQKGWV